MKQFEGDIHTYNKHLSSQDFYSLYVPHLYSYSIYSVYYLI